MTRPYLTELGKIGEGSAGNTDPRKAMELIHDLLKRAASDNLNVSSIVGSLRAEVRDRFYKDMVSVLFAQSLREILHEGGHVRILVWNTLKKGLLSSSILNLIQEEKTSQSKGSLDIRLSGTSARSEEVPHFIIAHSDDRRPWMLRIERPHKEHDMFEPMTETDPPIPAALIFGKKAKEEAEPLLSVFDSLFKAADNKEMTLSAVREYM